MEGSIRPEIVPSPSPSSLPLPLPDKCMPWTNEKHNRYLNYLEASFVKQLHRTMDSRARCKDRTEINGNIHQSLSFNRHKSSEEVSSVPNGKDQPHSYTVFQPRSLDVYERKYEHQLQSQDKNMIMMKSNGYKRSSLEDSYLSRFCQHSSDESVTEGTDQNFVDDGCQKSSQSASVSKKLKMTAALEDTLNENQIPFGEHYSSDKSMPGFSSLEEEEEGGKT